MVLLKIFFNLLIDKLVCVLHFFYNKMELIYNLISDNFFYFIGEISFRNT